jgi:hypothetical protein
MLLMGIDWEDRDGSGYSSCSGHGLTTNGRMGMLENLSRGHLPSLIDTMSRYSNSAKL